MSLYDDIGAPADSDQAALTRAHRKAAKRSHPDHGGQREEFERVTRAWMVLRDPAKRARYDETGHVDDAPDNSLSVLTEILTTAFDTAMSNCNGDFDHVDIIASMKRTLEADLIKIARVRAENEVVQRKMAKAKGRMKFKGDGKDVLAAMLGQRLQGIGQQIANLEERRKSIASALEHLKHYGFEFTPRPVQPAWDMAPGAINMMDEIVINAILRGSR